MTTLIRVSEEILNFRNELTKHPDLYVAAAALPTFSEIVGYVAASLGVAINGMFTEEEMRKLLNTLTALLYQRRGMTVITIDAPTKPVALN